MKTDIVQITNNRFSSRAFSFQHLMPYEYVKRFAKGKVILDAGTGNGYGANYLSDIAKEVVGIDVDEKLIAQAPDIFSKDNIRFFVNNVLDIKFPDGYYDIIISSQVIEHIGLKDLDTYLTEMSRVLKKDGIFFVSTLNLINNLKGKSPNRYDKSPKHVREFTPAELANFLRTRFSNVEVLGLHRSPRHACYNLLKKSGIFRKIPARLNPVKRFYEDKIDLNDFVYSRSKLKKSFDLMGICRK